jgi:hypothetical protein
MSFALSSANIRNEITGKTMLSRVGQYMSKYIVPDTIFKNQKSEEWFDLLSSGPKESPYFLVKDVMSNIKLVWQNAHLYRVKNDYPLSLGVLSHEALPWGIKAPEMVKH